MKKTKKSNARKQNEDLSNEERINSALLYTPEIFTWTKKDNTKE